MMTRFQLSLGRPAGSQYRVSPVFRKYSLIGCLVLFGTYGCSGSGTEEGTNPELSGASPVGVATITVTTGSAEKVSSIPEISSPSPGSSLTGEDVSFSWVSNGMTVIDWYLRVGDSIGSSEYADVRIMDATERAHVVNGLPTDGRKLYVEFSYKTPSGNWITRNFEYTAGASVEIAAALPVSNTPELTIPSPGAILSGEQVTFNWDSNGFPVDDWFIRVGDNQGTTEYADVRLRDPDTTSQVVDGLPLDGRSIYVEFSYKLLTGTWVVRNFSYKAADITEIAEQEATEEESEIEPIEPSPQVNASNNVEPEVVEESVEEVVEPPSQTSAVNEIADDVYGPRIVGGVCPDIDSNFSRSTYVDSFASFDSAYRSAQPGDAIIIRNGTYNWTNSVATSNEFPKAAKRPYQLNRSGTLAAPIYIVAESLHGVHFNTSRIDWIFNGKYNVMAGFKITDPGKMYVLSEGARIACNDFSEMKGGGYVFVEDHDADQVEIDNNVFDDSVGSALVLWRCNPVFSSCTKNSKGAHIHHNTFTGKAYANGENGHEAIVLGLNYSPVPEVRTYNVDGENMDAIVENNLFDGWNGEHELITIKSSRNIIRNNCVINSPRANFVLRNGNDNLITGNWMEGASGGIEISGRNNTIVYNYKSKGSGDTYGFRFHVGEQYLPSFFPGQGFEQLLGYIDASGNKLSYNVLNEVSHLANTRDQIGHIFRWQPTGNVLSGNDIYSSNHSGNDSAGGYINNDGKFSESQFRSQNTWGTNSYKGYKLNDSTCGNPDLFVGPGGSKPSYQGTSNLQGGQQTITPPSWW